MTYGSSIYVFPEVVEVVHLRNFRKRENLKCEFEKFSNFCNVMKTYAVVDMALRRMSSSQFPTFESTKNLFACYLALCVVLTTLWYYNSLLSGSWLKNIPRLTHGATHHSTSQEEEHSDFFMFQGAIWPPVCDPKPSESACTWLSAYNKFANLW